MKLRVYGEDGTLKPSIKEGYDQLHKERVLNNKLKAELKQLEGKVKETQS